MKYIKIILLILIIFCFSMYFYTKNNQYYTIKFYIDDILEKEINVKKGEIINDYPDIKTKEGYTFSRWMINDDVINEDYKVYSNLDIKGYYIIDKIKVTFKNNDDIKEIYIDSGSKVEEIIHDDLDGFIFLGWYINDIKFDFNSLIYSNIILEAKWQKQILEVKFNTDGGSSVPNLNIEYGKTIGKINNPIKKGYVFLGWYYNNKVYSLDNVVTENLILKAKWKIDDTLPILVDGTINNEYFNITMNANTEELANTTRNGINNAIIYAQKNNIKDLKLVKGTYVVTVTNNDGSTSANLNGIKIQSNINFNLNGSTIKAYKNSSIRYSVIIFDNVTNAKIYNGKVMGDRNEHDYLTVSDKTHEWGHGIKVANSSYIEIDNIDVSNVCGDGILVSNKNDYTLSKEGVLNKEIVNTLNNTKHKVLITNSHIHYYRRNGISIIAGDDIKIYKNTINDCLYVKVDLTNSYTKESVAPRAGIDIERDSKYQVYANIQIDSNLIYDIHGVAIGMYDYFQNFKILNNTVSHKISINKKNASTYPFCYKATTFEEVKQEFNMVVSNNKVVDKNSSFITRPDKVIDNVSNDELINFKSA